MSEPRAESMVGLTIDGRQVRAPSGTYVLQAARAAGLDIPTLCDHPDLEPVGACRLCMVEVSRPEWKGGSSDLVTSCIYPVSEGLVVDTRSERVAESRKQVLSLLAARCPGSQVVQRLAERYGASTGTLRVDPASDNCVLCGLCTRVCDTYATSAITTYNRGSTKAVGHFGLHASGLRGVRGLCRHLSHGPHSSEEGPRGVPHLGAHVRDQRLQCARATSAPGAGAARRLVRSRWLAWYCARMGLESPPFRRSIAAACGACVGACPAGAIEQAVYNWDRMLASAPEGGVR